jgi:hypothetical protein
MVKTASLFSQLLQHIPRTEFASLVKKHRAEYASKGFKSWTQLVSMLFCHLADADSLREICNGLACCVGKLAHLGITDSPKKSTLAYANAHRSATLFEELYYSTLKRFRSQGLLGQSKKPFRFKNQLQSLDSTVISLCLDLFPWAKFRRAKGGVKIHVLLGHGHEGYMPTWALISEAKTADVKAAQSLHLNPGSIVAMDRAYNDYELFGSWCGKGIFFVTRMKTRTRYEVVESRRPPKNRSICTDEIIRLTSKKAQADCPHLLRRIVVWDSEKEREIVFLTNHLDFGATTIAAIYKERWKIELFFKALKQTLRVRTFVGTSENALRVQIWTALLAMLLLKWAHYLSQAGWSFSNLASMLRLNLFTYRDLKKWLADPLGTPPTVPDPEQLQLSFQGLGQPRA